MERTATTLSEGYQLVLKDVLTHPEYECAPRKQAVKEVLGYRLVITQPDTSPIITADADRNLTIKDYTAKELQLHSQMVTSAKDMSQASSFWNNLANPDGSINSAYGFLIWGDKSCANPKFGAERLTPWEWAINTLKRDKDSRQAIILLNKNENHWVGNQDIPCTNNVHFLIRNDTLQMFVDMRSNDVVFGLTYDLVFFTHVMHKALDELKEVYPTLRLGSYSHYAHSMHIYARHYPLVAKMMYGDR
jgi:thymidylate synthase